MISLFAPDYIWIPVTLVVFLGLAVYSYKKHEKAKVKTMTYLFLSWEQIAGIPVFIIWMAILRSVTVDLTTNYILGMTVFTLGAHITSTLVEGAGWYLINYKSRYKFTGIGFLDALKGFYAGLVIGLGTYLKVGSDAFRGEQTRPGSLFREIFEYAGIARALDWPVYVIRIAGTYLSVVIFGLNGGAAIAIMLTLSSFYYGTIWSALFYPSCQRRIESG